MWLPDDTLRDSWARLLADPDTAAAFAPVALEPLIDELAWREPRATPDEVATAAEIAVLAVIKRPERYDPTRLPLPAYLLMIARRKLKTVRAAESRHQRSRIPWDSVEEDLPGRNELAEDDSPSFDHPELRAVIATFTPAEQRVLDLQRCGERRTAVFAEGLGIADRPVSEQEAEVKRVKDRILKRLQRAARGAP
jgi:hypothetical protein